MTLSFCYAEVEDLDLTCVRHENVVRSYVTMYDVNRSAELVSRGVCILQCTQNAACNVYGE